ncbi:MAG: asparagine synthase (glutamine-hydrolyzing) [Planctomycetales bacterium]
MCGIAGAVWTDPSAALPEDAHRRMVDALRHRGPDDEGFRRGEFQPRPGYDPTPGFALGQRRLAVIDVEGGSQPISNEDGSVWAVFNGEIYNDPELRRRLEGSGHKFRTGCDAEILPHLYEDEGPGFAKHLVGMFAAAVWDVPRGRLVLVRDRLGQKPLVYRAEKHRLLFASELKGLLQAPDVPRELDPAAIDEYLTFQYVPHPGTIFRGIRKLPPAHHAIFHQGRLTVERYWSPNFQQESNLTAKDAAEKLRSLLDDSTRRRMRSDVPLGAFLSGGLDSSIIVVLMQQHSDHPVKTFSIGFDSPEYDESAFAQEVSQANGCEHHALRIQPNALEILPKLVQSYDEPFADSSAIPTYYLAQFAREHVTVALSGDGGDELFAGYPRYGAVRLGQRLDALPSFLRGAIAGRGWLKLPSGSRQKSRLRQWKRFVEAINKPPCARYAEWIAIFNESRRAELYTGEFIERLPDVDPVSFLQVAWQESNKRDPVTTASLTDLATYLPCDLMTKVDVASMAHGLECRGPFLDHRVVEFAAALPIHMKLRWGQGKRILRETFADLVPASVLRRPKQGFGVPLDAWFRGDYRDQLRETLLDPSALSRDVFRLGAVEQLIDEHLAMRFDHSARLWSLLVFEHWRREWTA